MMRALPLAAALVCAVVNLAAMPIQLAPNRAIYDLHLERSSPGGAVAARGRLVIEFRDLCDGWGTQQRMLTDMVQSDGGVSRSDFLVTSWESKDGRSMRFDIHTASRVRKEREKRGAAVMGADGKGVVSLMSPVRRKFALPAGTVFPTKQTLGMLNAAAQGKPGPKNLVFEGGDENDLYVSTVVIGRVSPLAPAQVLAGNSLLKATAAWPVLVSYFPVRHDKATPDYEVAADLFANGIIGSMSLIYPRYTLRATLARLEPLPRRC
jgi:EipB-like